jgi:hypothetical protein
MEAPTPTEVSMTAGWFPVFTLLLGFAMKYVTDWIQNRRDVAKDSLTRKETRRDVIVERRTTFQRATLLELQEAVQDLARAAGASHHHDEKEYRKTGKWQKVLLGDDLNDEFFLTNRRVLLLAVRVRDTELRGMVNKFRGLVSGMLNVGRNASDQDRRDASNAALSDDFKVLEEIHERIGQLFRQMDSDEDVSG